jgi:hypothetical protein
MKFDNIQQQGTPLRQIKKGQTPGAPEGYAVPAPLLLSFVLLLNDTNSSMRK